MMKWKRVLLKQFAILPSCLYIPLLSFRRWFRFQHTLRRRRQPSFRVRKGQFPTECGGKLGLFPQRERNGHWRIKRRGEREPGRLQHALCGRRRGIRNRRAGEPRCYKSHFFCISMNWSLDWFCRTKNNVELWYTCILYVTHPICISLHTQSRNQVMAELEISTSQRHRYVHITCMFYL